MWKLRFGIWQIALMSFLASAAASDESLIVSYGSHDAEPYAIVENGELTGGIIKEIMDEVGREIEIEIQYQNIPRMRMDQYLLSGQSHVRVISSPRWYKSPEQFLWSTPLFQESGRYVVSAEKEFPIREYDDLTGKKVGTIRGYQYPEGLVKRFESGEIIRDDVTSLATNFERLKLNRIDALLDADILIFIIYRKTRQAAPSSSRTKLKAAITFKR